MSLYIICVTNKFSQFCVICVGVWNFAALNVRMYIKFWMCIHAFHVWELVTCAIMPALYMSTCVHICTSCGILVHCLKSIFAPRVLPYTPMLIYKRWNEDRKTNQCSRCLRAYRFSFHFPHRGKTKNDTWVNEQTAEVIWGNATVDFWHETCYICRLQQISAFCWAC